MNDELHWTQDWVFEPKDDITILELAKPLAQIKIRADAKAYGEFTDDVKRHFVARQVRG